ncbi:hypothetical protein BKI52_02630 [marine bacterium AO1-C]|nr:hypothetical protein BKI52_02630 [marine bacterium AO1-C]
MNPANPELQAPTRTEAIRDGIQFQFLQDALNQALDGDTIRLIDSTTEDVVFPAYLQKIWLVIDNCTLNGSISTPIINGMDRGIIQGRGNATITGSISVLGASQFSLIEGLNLQGNGFRSERIHRCKIVGYDLSVTSGNGVLPTLLFCELTNDNTLFRQYGSSGLSFQNCIINTRNFSPRIGGISSIGGSFRFKNTTVLCTQNGLAWRGTANLYFENSTFKCDGVDYYLFGDAGGTANIYAENSKLITAGAELYQAPTNYTHINLQRNKEVGASAVEVYSNQDQLRTNIVI